MAEVGNSPLARGDTEWRAAYTVALVAAVAGAVGLHLARRHSFLLFHTLAELFAIVIAAGVFMVVWNTRRLVASHYLLIAGVAYLGAAGLDLAHTLTYQGMRLIGQESTDAAAQLWIAARYVEASGLLVAPSFLRRRANAYVALAVALATMTLLLLAVLSWRIFPESYVEGAGLTPFKIASEYVVSGMLVAAGLWLYRERAAVDRPVLWLILMSIVTTIATELTFTVYVDPYSFTSEVGHYLKILSFWFLYKAAVEGALRRPYSVLFHDLKRREEDLARSNRELEGYAQTVSHDLRTPLSVVVTSTEVLNRLAADPSSEGTREKIQRLARLIGSSAHNAVALSEDLLALAAAGQRPAAVSLVDVDEVVAQLLHERAALLRERNVTVEVSGTLGSVRASPAHLYQLFANLVGNSIQHNDKPEPRIVIERSDSSTRPHRFRVRDNGPGIPEEHLDKIFTPFFKSRGGGHGIGLSIVQRIVSVYGGRVSVHNDGGACFELELYDL